MENSDETRIPQPRKGILKRRETMSPVPGIAHGDKTAPHMLVSRSPSDSMVKNPLALRSPRSSRRYVEQWCNNGPQDQQLASTRSTPGKFFANSQTDLPSSSGSRPPRPSSTPRRSSSKPSQIPKLSVSWWETNSVAGEAPHDESASDTDETSSIRSYCSSVSANWQGKSTRFVPHCEKRHMHNQDPGEYLTPTQRKNRLIADLRKQLRNALKTIEEKEKHIEQLRERLTELETVLDQGGVLSENHRLLLKIKQQEEKHRKEKEQLIQKYETRLRKLRKCLPNETDLTGTNWGSSLQDIISPKTQTSDYDSGVTSDGAEPPKLDDVDTESNRKYESTADIGIMTEWDISVPERELVRLQSELQAAQLTVLSQQNRLLEVENSSAHISKLESGMAHYANTVKPAHEACPHIQCQVRHAELIAQLDAYRNECLAWRTKASELEIALKNSKDRHEHTKEELQRSQAMLGQLQAQDEERQTLAADGMCPYAECVELRDRMQELEEMLNSAGQTTVETETDDRAVSTRGSISSVFSLRVGTSGSRSGSPGIGIQLAAFQNLAENLRDENRTLCDQNESYRSLIEEQGAQLDIKSEKLETAMHELCESRDDMNSLRTELEVSNLTLERLRDNNSRLQEQIKLHKEQMEKIERAGVPKSLDGSGVAVTETFIKKKTRFGLIETKSRLFQTDLTMQQIDECADSLKAVQKKYDSLDNRYETETKDYEFKLKEAAENLRVKHQLAESLNTQLQQLQQDFQDSQERWSSEREFLTKRVHELTPIAARVPGFEADLKDANEECHKLRMEFRDAQEHYEYALEKGLKGTLKGQQDTEVYWQDKTESLKEELKALREKMEKTEVNFKETKLHLMLEKAETEQKLQAAISESTHLYDEIHKEKISATVQTDRPGMDKGISCKPKRYEKSTRIFEGELYCEKSETIKLLQGELETTRRQIQILQEKIDELRRQSIVEIESKSKKLMDMLNSYQEELKKLKMEHIAEINEKTKLEGKLENVVKERDSLRRKEKENLEKLEKEFHLVQKELKNVVNRYEMEKVEMETRVKEAEEDTGRLTWKLKTLKLEMVTLLEKGGSLDAAEKARVINLLQSPSPVRSISTGEGAEGKAQGNDAGFPLSGMLDSGISVRSQESPARSLNLEPTGLRTIAMKLAKENALLKEDLQQFKNRVSLLIGALKDAEVQSDPAEERIETIIEEAEKIATGQATVASETQAKLTHSHAMQREVLSNLENIAADIEIVLEDHAKEAVNTETIQGIVQNQGSIEKRLDRWLTADLQQEKLELEVINQWYDKDKPKLQKLLTDLKKEYKHLNQEKEYLAVELESSRGDNKMLHHVHKEVCRELELYKREELTHLDELQKRSSAKLTSKSEGNLSSKLDGTADGWNTQASKMFKEVVSLEKKYRAAKYEKQEANEETRMTRGQLEVLRAKYENDRDKLLAKLEQITGEVWTSEGGEDFVRELQRNLEIKKQELYDLGTRYESDVRQLHEELYAERAKKGNADYIKEVTRMLDNKDSEIAALREQLKEGPSSSPEEVKPSKSKVLLKRQIEKEREEIMEYKRALEDDRKLLETKIIDLNTKFKSTMTILHEKENIIKILERELKMAEESLTVQKNAHTEDLERLQNEITVMEAAKQEILKTAAQHKTENVVKIEKLWKSELKSMKDRYESEIKSLRRDLVAENNRLENCRKVGGQKLHAINTILTEKEDQIRILEKELRSMEDGFKMEKGKHTADVKELRDMLAYMKQLLTAHGVSYSWPQDSPILLRHQQSPTQEATATKAPTTEPVTVATPESIASSKEKEEEEEEKEEEEEEEAPENGTVPQPKDSFASQTDISIASATEVVWPKPVSEKVVIDQLMIRQKPETCESEVQTDHVETDTDSSSLSEGAIREEIVTDKLSFRAQTESCDAELQTDPELFKSEEELFPENVAHETVFLAASSQNDVTALETDQSVTIKQADKAKASTDRPLKLATPVPDADLTPAVEKRKPPLAERVTETAPKPKPEAPALMPSTGFKRITLSMKNRFPPNVPETSSSSSSIQSTDSVNYETTSTTEPKQEATATIPETTELGLSTVQVHKLKPVVVTEDKVVQLKKELQMANKELLEHQKRFTDEQKRWNTETDSLTEKIQDLAQKAGEQETQLEQAVDIAETLQAKVNKMSKEAEEREQKHQEMYMIMFRKGQDLAKAELELDTYQASTSGSVPDPAMQRWDVEEFQAKVHKEVTRLKQVQDKDGKMEGLSSEQILLRFLHDAVYYYLLGKDPKDHLNCIMSILNFTDTQRTQIKSAKGNR